jgi:hypothetical protein
MLCKIWGFHGGDYEEWRLLGYKTPVRTSQETHYVSTTESRQLMLCKIWGFHGGDNEEWRLLGYKTPARTSQETHYVSTTESSQLMLCLQEPHGVTTQKTPFFIVTAVKTSWRNPTTGDCEDTCQMIYLPDSTLNCLIWNLVFKV